MFLLIPLLACSDKPGDTGAPYGDVTDGGSGPADTGYDTGYDTGGEAITETWAATYLGSDLVLAEVTRTPLGGGGTLLEGTTVYDYSAYIDYSATLTEEVELDADGLLRAAEVSVSATVGALEYRERLSLDAEAGTAKITRPAGSWTWAYEADAPIFYWNYASDIYLAFNQGTPISAEVLVRAARSADTVAWVAHDYLSVYSLPGGEGSSYSLGDTIEVGDDGSITGITLRDLGITMSPVERDLELSPVSVEHGAGEVVPPDCALTGSTETFEVISLDGTTIAGEVTWPPEHGGAVVTFNAGTGGADRREQLGGLPRWECLAAPFLSAGVAVVRYDDRAHGASGGSFEEMTFTARTEDALAVAQWASQQPATEQLFLLGHSEGVAHVSEVAALADFPVDGLLLLAGVGDYTGLDVWIGQAALYLDEHGFDPGFIDEQVLAMEQIADQILSGTYPQDTFGSFPLAFWEDFFVFNGAELATAAGLPAFVAQGDRDWQVPVDNGRSLAAALEAAELPVSYYEVSGAGHFLSAAPADFPMSGDEYNLPIGWDEGLLEAAVTWVSEQAPRRAAAPPETAARRRAP